MRREKTRDHTSGKAQRNIRLEIVLIAVLFVIPSQILYTVATGGTTEMVVLRATLMSPQPLSHNSFTSPPSR